MRMGELTGLDKLSNENSNLDGGKKPNHPSRPHTWLPLEHTKPPTSRLYRVLWRTCIVYMVG